nr:hypothetical protein [Saccharofermentans sp.]
MALVKGTNSYVTVAEANTYFSDRLDAAAWVAADDVIKAQALVTATGLFEDLRWAGVAISESQPLAFPRTGSYFDPRLGTFVYINNETPGRISKATNELALHLLENDSVLDDTGSVGSITLEGISITNIRKPEKIPGMICGIITFHS